MRDSASWDTLDKAIGRLGGTGAGNATAATINGAAAVAALAAAHVVSPGESDEDEEDTGDVLLIGCCCCCSWAWPTGHSDSRLWGTSMA